MLECLLNQEPKIIDSGLKTWGDLLDGLDDDCAADRRAVTAVRFDGVDQPSFRAPHVARLPLAPIRRIEIETVDRTRLLKGALRSAYQSLPVLATASGRAAEAFRGRDLAGAHEQLTALVEAIRTLTMLTVASATAGGTDLDRMDCGGDTASDILGSAGVVLDGLAQWQQSFDWIALADTLEFDLPPALLKWGAVFEAMEERCAA